MKRRIKNLDIFWIWLLLLFEMFCKLFPSENKSYELPEWGTILGVEHNYGLLI